MRNSKFLVLSLCFLLIMTSIYGTDFQDGVKEDITTPTIAKENLTPAVVLDAPIQLTHLKGAFEGYNLFVLGEWNTTAGVRDYYLVITDMNGDSLVEKYVGRGFYGTIAEFINSTTLLIGTEDGAALWNYYDDTMVYFNVTGHHEYEYNHISNTIFTFNSYEIEIEGENYRFDYIEEYDDSGTLVWSLDTRDFISHTWWCPFGDLWYDTRDITHSNTIYFDADEDTIYYNSRNTNTFFKINHGTKKVEWGLGEYGNFTNYDIYGAPKNELFYHAHAIEPIDDNTFILFDNDYHNQVNIYDRNSRIVEITINTDKMTARESWVWEAPSDYWSIRWGDADRLPNGNRLGTFGTESHPTSSLSARLVEVNDAGKIVWEMSFEKPGDLQYVVYDMDRILFSPLLEYTGTNSFGKISNVTLSWDAWNNYRPKHSVPGEYTLYLNESEIDSGFLNYDKYWRPTNLEFNIGILPSGIHKVTLCVTDDGGHQTNDTISIKVDDFVINHFGNTQIEQGLPHANITWSGSTVYPLICNITLNSIIDREIIWTGEDILLNLTTLPAGLFETELFLYNTTTLLYQDAFTIRIQPQEEPEFLSTPLITSIVYSNKPILEWELFDWSPTIFFIYLDSIVVYSSKWDGGIHTLYWSFPFLALGTYNLTVQMTDSFGLHGNHTLIIEVTPMSPPAIVSQPDDTAIMWGSDDIEFHWTVYGGNGWRLYKNGTELHTGTITSPYLIISIEKWQEEGWRIDTYNLTLEVYDSVSSSSVTSWIEVIYAPGDPYADIFLDDYSEFVLNGINVIGAPDNVTATAYMDYTNGYVTVDMGQGEEIIDGIGFDFSIYISGGEYIVYISNSLATIFTRVSGIFYGNASIDISGTGLASVRYVRILYYSGSDLEIDAIEAINFNSHLRDDGAPVITGPEDITLGIDDYVALLTWSAVEQTPWSYQILINDSITTSDIWTGSTITFTFIRSLVGIYNVTLIVEDAFGNSAADSVMIIVQGEINDMTIGMIAVTAVAVPIILTVVWFSKKKN